jgi:hypothetical protein
MALRHGVTSCSAGRTKRAHCCAHPRKSGISIARNSVIRRFNLSNLFSG